AYAFWLWLHRPDDSRKRVLYLAAAVAFAFLCKFSAVLFVPAAFAAILVCHFAAGGRLPRRPFASLGAAAAMAIVLIWAGYHFSFTTPEAAGAGKAFRDARGMYARLVNVRIPAPELLHGLLAI